jgi:ABC-type transport system involved in cytochrome bd biosynthesis fused ATPase/permease subunit
MSKQNENSKERLDAVTLTLTDEQIDLIAKLRNLANAEATRNTELRKAIRASVTSAISAMFDLGVNEQIRRYEKAVKDAEESAKQDAENLRNAANAAFMQRVADCKGDATKIAAVVAEFNSKK